MPLILKGEEWVSYPQCPLVHRLAGDLRRGLTRGSDAGSSFCVMLRPRERGRPRTAQTSMNTAYRSISTHLTPQHLQRQSCGVHRVTTFRLRYLGERMEKMTTPLRQALGPIRVRSVSVYIATKSAFNQFQTSFLIIRLFVRPIPLRLSPFSRSRATKIPE